MRLLEHQAKELLGGFGLPFTRAWMVDSPQAVAQVAAELGREVVLKAQVPFGGRGKAGAIKFARDPEEAKRAAGELFGMNLRGHTINAVSVEARVAFRGEFYAGITWDTTAKLPVALFTMAGGIAVEESSAAEMHRRVFDPWTGFHAYEAREFLAAAGLTGQSMNAIAAVFQKLAHAFLTFDAVVAEINPLVETTEGEWIGLDARFEIEDDAAYRQKEHLAPLGPMTTTAAGRAPTPLELEAQRIDAMDHRGVAGRVVEFEGNLALLIGGGGASLTVFDAIRRYGGRPTNYCEIGGNPTAEKVAALTEVLLAKPKPPRLAVIMNVVNNTRADVIAQGVLMGLERAGCSPSETLVVFRVPGSWENEARILLAQAGVQALGREVSLDAAAKLAVERMPHHAA